MKKIITLAIALLIFFGIFKLLSQAPSTGTTTDDQADMILYWGVDCPHCENVKKYITDNNLDSKLKINQKEVYYNKQNQNEMLSRAQKCNLDTSNGMGVPFAFFTSDSTCVLGDQPIIDRLDKLSAITP